METENPTIRHAPDDSSYHTAPADQVSRMRGSRVGKFAIIPSARNNGLSRGFDPTVAGPVHVDPYAKDGGVIFDPDAVDSHEIEAAVAMSQYPHEAYYRLGTMANHGAVLTSDIPESAIHVDTGRNAIMPNSYVTPHQVIEALPVLPVPPLNMDGKSNPMQNQPTQAVQPVPYQPQQNTQASVQPAYVPPQYALSPAQYQPQYPLQYAPQPLPDISALVASVSAMQQQMATVINQMNQRQSLPPTTGMSANPLPSSRTPKATSVPRSTDEDEENVRPIRQQVRRSPRTQEITDVEPDEYKKPQRVKDYVDSEMPETDQVIVGFEKLNLAFVNGPLPLKAKRRVMFELPEAGQFSTVYHEVIDSARCVALVYDTRYVDGTQYVPPDLPDKVFSLHVPHMKKTIEVSSMGLTFSLGVFDVIVLVKAGDKALNYDDA